ncbi:uncharacterized protein LOC110459947 isoform X1 [Mizuhopecten yessoensis]|uniref:uncharacterized protein LOC110459947 isoform X1 n=1 Tax=Mizuhopecten yessoensis TaxID=6573 RepID=UPI000B45BFCA|nr:uncharacterized protein LOC110459947 isoform X1 [Mizuhopecten yessoensis]
MGSIDSIPVISQIKSLVQVISGDEEGALRTQQNFADTGIIASQVQSLIHAINGDTKAAEETQKKFGKSLESLVDSVPVIGHIKGAVHYGLGDTKRGDQIMKSSSGSLITGVAGIAGTLVGGPAGGAAAAVAASQLYDGVVTGIDTAVNGKTKDGSPRYYGIWQTVDDIEKGKAKSGDIFDAYAGIGMDALGGATIGKVGGGVKGFAKAVGKDVRNSLPGLDTITKAGKNIFSKNRKSICRGKRDVESHLTINEVDFATGHQRLPESFSEVLRKDWQNMGVNDTVSNLVSMFIILRLVMWNDKRGRSYSSELCSMTSSGFDEITTCQIALANTIREMENRLTSDNGGNVSYILHPNVTFTTKMSSNTSVVMIKSMTTLYGILSNMATGRKMGITWTYELCLYEDLNNFKLCEKEVLSKLAELGGKAFLLGEHRKLRIRRGGGCRKTSDVTSGSHRDVKKSNKKINKVLKKDEVNKKAKIPGELQSNHIPAQSAFKKTYPNIHPDDLIAHRLNYEVHGIAMSQVGTSGSRKISKKLRAVEEHFIQNKQLADAIKVDLIASYGRANVRHATDGFRSALIENAADMRKVIDLWEEGVPNGGKPPLRISKKEAQSLRTFLDNEIQVYNNYPNHQGSLAPANWDKWLDRMEIAYEGLVDKTQSLGKDNIKVEQDRRNFG